MSADTKLDCEFPDSKKKISKSDPSEVNAWHADNTECMKNMSGCANWLL